VHNYINAVRRHGVKNVILMSSLGAHLREGSGIVDGLADMEVAFSELKDVNVLILRAGYFMENLYFELNRLRSSGIIGSTIRGDLKFPVVAAKDIAAIVEQRLLSLDFKGHTIEYVLGPKDLSFNEIAEILGKALNRPEIKYKRFNRNDYRKEMIQSGYISENVADAFIGMEDVFNNGKGLGAHTRTIENSTPTTFEEFATGIAYTYHHQTAA
jgi:nucleoside-diphosphate-sugar epimerase